MEEETATTVLQHLLDPPGPPGEGDEPGRYNIIATQGSLTTSTKAWLQPYGFGQWVYKNTSLRTFEEVYGPLDYVDKIRLGAELEMEEYQAFIATEAEVQNLFKLTIDHPVQAAWQPRGVWFRYQIGPPQSVLKPNASMTADVVVLSYRPGDNATPLVVGDFKKPGIIKPEEWKKHPRNAASSTQKLVAEIRGYAHQYGCHDAFLFDGFTYVAVLFPCANREEIATCEIQVRVLDLYSVAPNVTVRRCLYSQIRNGYQRLRAIKAMDIGSVILGWRLGRVYWSGRMLWYNPATGAVLDNHPDLRRGYDPRARQWVWSGPEGSVLLREENAL